MLQKRPNYIQNDKKELQNKCNLIQKLMLLTNQGLHITISIPVRFGKI